jgi:hypothetical protein
MKRLMISLMALGALALAEPASAHGYAQHHDKAPAKHSRGHHHAAKTTEGRHKARHAAKTPAKAAHRGTKAHGSKHAAAKHTKARHHAAKPAAAKHARKTRHTADRPVVIPPAHHRHY